MESIIVSRLLPDKGDYELVKTTKDFKPTLNFTEEEMRKFDIESKKHEETGRQMISFSHEATEGYLRDIKFPPLISSHVSKTLKEMSDKGELTEDFVPVYEKFVL